MRRFLAVGCLAALLTLGLAPASHAAQCAAVDSGPNANATRIDIDADGLISLAASAPINSLITSVAHAAGYDVTSVGEPACDLVTVTFAAQSTTAVLRDLMDPAGISFLTVEAPAGGRGRLIFGRLRDGMAGLRAAALTLQPADAVVTAPVSADGAASRPPVMATDDAAAQPRGPTEWPAGIQPASMVPDSALPQTVEELIATVNASRQSSGSRDLPGVGLISQTPPVQATTTGTARPGMPVASAVILDTQADLPGATYPHPAPVDPSRLKAPETFEVPAPTVVRFPAPVDR
jgi:hypothetical protein